MSNFYDLENDLTAEDYAPQEEESYSNLAEFAAFDPGDAESRWGNLDFEELINELENYVATSKRYLFFSRRKRVVNGEEMSHLMQYILNKMPGEFANAKSIITERDAIINNARMEEKSIVDSAQSYYQSTTQKATDDAEKIMQTAREKAEEMVAAHSITQAARVRADEIRENCQKEMAAFVAQTQSDCENHKQQARDWASQISQGSYNFVCDALSKYQTIAMNNLNEITDVYKQFQSGYESHMQTLQADTSVHPAQNAAVTDE